MESSDSVINKIDNLFLHDATLNNVSIDFFHRQLILEVIRTSHEGIIKLQFTEVRKISMPQIDIWEDVEIFSLKAIRIDNNQYSLSMVCLLGYALPSFEINFEFTHVKIII
jgi:hypothetical protein